MAYSPNVSLKSSCSLRRLAWAMNVPMTKALEEVIQFLPHIINRRKVCKNCRDKSKCEICLFHAGNNDKTTLTGMLKKIKVSSW